MRFLISDGPMHSLYIYCDILEHIPVGDVAAPLLRVIGITGKQGDTIRKTYDKPMYVPVRMKNFDSIEIDIRTDTGESVPFQYGKSEVILHFKLRKESIFSYDEAKRILLRCEQRLLRAILC